MTPSATLAATRRAQPLAGAARRARALVAACAALLVCLCAARAEGVPGVRAEGPNRLIDAGSAYLLQHAHNPVDWYPWGEEALARARRENKPIFLSVGYSSCHWCHVANRTLYSNPEIAALMNRWFVNIKVDREQRPDIDAIYMRATGVMTGRGGWPNNVFLTPGAEPFFGGSYFPPEDDDFGRPGFVTVLRTIHEEWRTQPDRLRAVAARVMDALRRPVAASGSPALSMQAWRREVERDATARFDDTHAGFPFPDSPSQFPLEPLLGFLIDSLRERPDAALRAKLTATLEAIARGALHDHVGGGFYRYSIERSWSVPHFEKLLLTNAQLLTVFTDAWELTRDPLYRAVAYAIADYLVGRLRSPGGGFYVSEDAEVDGREGANYLWNALQIRDVLGDEDARRLLRYYALQPLQTRQAAALEAAEEGGPLRMVSALPAGVTPVDALRRTAALRARLLEARNARPQPARDEKIIVSGNGLAILAFARAGRVFGEPRFVGFARAAAQAVWKSAYDPKARLLRHEIFRGRAGGEGFLDDYALLGLGMLELAQAEQARAWRDRAAHLAEDLVARLARPDGSLALSPRERALIIRPEDRGDQVQPSGTSAAIAFLLRLHEMGGGQRFLAPAQRALAGVQGRVAADPGAWPTLIASVARAGAEFVPGGDPVALDTAAHVKVSARVQPRASHDEVIVRVRIAPGYHVNANPASFDYLIPTEVRIEGARPEHIAYPAGRLLRPAFARTGIRVYEGALDIVVRVPKDSVPADRPIRGSLRAQACTDEVCLPPADIPLAKAAVRRMPN